MSEARPTLEYSRPSDRPRRYIGLEVVSLSVGVLGVILPVWAMFDGHSSARYSTVLVEMGLGLGYLWTRAAIHSRRTGRYGWLLGVFVVAPVLLYGWLVLFGLLAQAFLPWDWSLGWTTARLLICNSVAVCVCTFLAFRLRRDIRSSQPK